MTDDLKWVAYTVQQTDAFGYDKTKFGVREQYSDGATRYIHNQVMDSKEEAESLAARFNLNRRKGKTYDNVMKEWSP